MRKLSTVYKLELLDKAESFIDGSSGSYTPTFAVVGMDGEAKRYYERVDGSVREIKYAPNAVLLPEKLESFLFPKKFKVAFGGRGSAKTRTIAALLVDKARTERHRILCCREIQGSIADSSYQEIVDEIDRRGCLDEFRITNTNIIHKKTKTKFMFRGLHRNWTSIKGIAGLTLVWVEEAENISRKSWDVLVPTLRGCDTGEIWISFNPDKETDATYGDFVVNYLTQLKENGGVYEDKRISLVKINYTDNPWFPEILREEMEVTKENWYNRYLNIWEGHLTRPENEIIKAEWWHYYVDWQDVYNRCSFLFFVADTAYTEDSNNDPSLVQLWGTDGHRLYCLASTRGFWEFPDLLQNTKRFMDKFPKANTLYVEAKASGHSLAQSLRKKDINAIPWVPQHYGFPTDKVGRMQESAWLVLGGQVWLPDDDAYIEPMGQRGKVWNGEHVGECSMFTTDDSHDHDEYCDCTGMAVSIFQYYGGGDQKVSGK